MCGALPPRQKAVVFLTSWSTVSFWRRFLFFADGF
jgi:hypothetical protein